MACQFYMIQCRSVDEFNQLVNRFLSEGWVLHGESTVINNVVTGEFYCFQAVARDLQSDQTI